MKVLVVSEPGTDGVFRYVDDLCRFLLDRGVEVHLAYSDRRGSGPLTALIETVEGRGGATLNLRTANRPGWGDIRAFRELHRFARRVAPDIIHSHSSKAGALARPLRWLGVGARQLYHPHAYAGMAGGRGAAGSFYNRVEQVLGRVGTTIACSSNERLFGVHRLRLPARRVRCIVNGVDPSRFDRPSPEQKRAARARYGLPPEAIILGCLARSAPQKDPLTAYRAFAAAGRPAFLWHAGTGELDCALRAEIARLGLADRIIRCDHADPVAFHQAIDGFILSSRYEGFSLAALEALATDSPLILSSAGGNLDLLALRLSHAWSAPPGDVPGFAAAICAWFDDLSLGRPSNHRRLALAHFDARRQFEAVLKLYREVLERPASVLPSLEAGVLE